MKASLKFREEQRPLVRAKIPISVLGLPFISGVSAGDPKELRLDLLTAFESGPSVRASYRPNDPANSFTVSVKTGIGSLGSPAGAPMSMTAEFSLLGGSSASPGFRLMFKPRLGDFSLKKSVASPALMPEKKAVSEVDEDATAVWVDSPGKASSAVSGGAAASAGIGGIGSLLLSGLEVSARSVLPLKSHAAVRFRWGVRMPPELRRAFAEDGGGVVGKGVRLGKMPLLVMSKISIEHVRAAEDDKGNKGKGKEIEVRRAAAELAEACIAVRKQLEAIQAENGMLKKAVEEVRGWPGPVTAVGGQVSPLGRDAEVGKGNGNGGKRNGGKYVESSGRTPVTVVGSATAQRKDEMEELKKALMGAAGSGN